MKIIKDPIYGYIKIEEDEFIKIINSPLFQRLKDIVQTSYTSVYPTSLHNRFTHSLGVFYLGKIAVESLNTKILKNFASFYSQNEKEIAIWSYTFKLACLLHDVGHAPFSHTGEVFYFEKWKGTAFDIWEDLKAAVESERFNNDASMPKGANHEIMSALIALEHVSNFGIEEFDKELFVRCIIGLPYIKQLDEQASYKNCLIGMLNSETVDVDRLDYLIRDSYMSGYDSVKIDYIRLLSSCYIDCNKEGLFSFAYSKAALSVLENVIIAHDAEKKWLQSHPVILYESWLVAGMIRFAISEYKKRGITLFSKKALSEEGVENEHVKVRLLSDSDILSFVKLNGYHEECVKSFFNRELRRKSFWKSEAEYKVLFESKFSTQENGNLSKIEKYFNSLNILLREIDDNQNVLQVINDDILTKLSNAVRRKGNTEERKELLKETIWLFKKLKGLCKKHNCDDFDFVILSANSFQSSFNKDAFAKIKVVFPDINRVETVDSSLNTLKSNPSRDEFFYLFAPNNIRDSIPVSEIIDVIQNFSSTFLEH